jgi:hypothetical protein
VSGKVAWAGELMLLEAKWSDKDGHTVKFKLVTPNEDRPNPFKAFTKRRSGRGGTRFHAALSHVGRVRAEAVAYNGEFMLAGWSDTSGAGYTVSFWCEAPEQGMHAFEGYRRSVDTFMAALVELDEDDQPVDQEKRERVEAAQKPEGPASPERPVQRLSTVAAWMCMAEDFWAWANQQGSDVPVISDDLAAGWMRKRLGVDSRRQLDQDPEVARRFHEEIRKPFVEWRERLWR